MKVYIKPWEEALKSAKEFDERLVDIVDGSDYIDGIRYPFGHWGHIVETQKENNGKFDYYHVGYNNYPACCAEEVTPEWLEEHADKFAEEIISTNNTENTWDKSNLENYETHRVTIYKAIKMLHTYFFYVKRVSFNGFDEVVEDFREIK